MSIFQSLDYADQALALDMGYNREVRESARERKRTNVGRMYADQMGQKMERKV